LQVHPAAITKQGRRDQAWERPVRSPWKQYCKPRTGRW